MEGSERSACEERGEYSPQLLQAFTNVKLKKTCGRQGEWTSCETTESRGLDSEESEEYFTFQNVHLITETAAADESGKMASRWKLGMGFVKLESGQCGEESSESENESDAVKPFGRKLSINRDTKSSDTTKEGFLLKQTSFQRWRRRYFRLRGRKLYYAKDAKALLFDEIELSSVSFGGIGTKNGNNSFQIITPYRRLVLAAETKQEMEEWMTAIKSASSKDYCDINSEIQGNEHEEFLSGHHHWYAASHARPTYCNVCREPLSGVTSHGLSCEICKCKVHKRCAVKAIPNCKWTTLASIGLDIIEDPFGNITMPHQWMEGNLPVSSKCSVCDKTCGSVLRLQDWRCLWCRASVHTACRPNHPVRCPLGPAKVSVVPPTALHSIGNDEAWEAVRPQGCSPLLVFVNSKSGENQGIKFLRRFKQLLNPAQVFDLIHGGPSLGLRLFRNFDPFRILVCSGDGSVGWVLSEIDRLNMHKQCQIGVLPLGTGNDLARVLGWGSSCDDETHLPQLLDKYEKASTKMLDRWSVMTLEKGMLLPRAGSRLSLDDPLLTSAMAEYEDNVMSHLAKIIQSDQHSVVISSAKILCETVKDFTMRIAQTTFAQGDVHFSDKCQLLNNKLDLLVQILEKEGGYSRKAEILVSEDATCDGEEREGEKVVAEKREKDIINLQKTGKSFVGKDALMSRANSLKKAVRQLVEYMEGAADQQNSQELGGLHQSEYPFVCHRGSKCSVEASGAARTADASKATPGAIVMPGCETTPSSSPRPSVVDVENQKMFLLPSPFPSRHSSRVPSAADIRLSALSPMPDIRRESACDEMLTLPVPDEFADNLIRRKSFPLESDKQSVARQECRTKESIENSPFPLDVKIYKGGTDAEKDLIDFEKDVICGFEKSEGPSLWETVLSSLNEDTRSVVSDSRESSRRNSRMDAAEVKAIGADPKCDPSCDDSGDVLRRTLPTKLVEMVAEVGGDDKSDPEVSKEVHSQGNHGAGRVQSFEVEGTTFSRNFNNRIEEMDLSHIDSSESPSEETSPPNRGSSPPPETYPEEPPEIPPSPRYIHKSRTENALGFPVSSSSVTRSWTDIPNEEEKGLGSLDRNLLKVSIREGNEISYPGVCGDEKKRTIYRRFSDVKTNKELSNEMSLKQGSLKRGRKSLDLYEHPFLCRKDSRKLYMDNDIDITDDIELEPELRCSLAQFVEGNDIARMSFKKKGTKKKMSTGDSEADMVKIRFRGSNGDLTKEWNEKFNAQNSKMDHRLSAAYSETDDEELVEHALEKKDKVRIKEVPEFQFIVDPPSPLKASPPEIRRLSCESIGKLSAASTLPTGLLHASPQATRRISNCSLMKAEIMEAFAEARSRSKSIDKGDVTDFVKKLPIINPLVRLPSWPNVSGGAGLISKVLLANADALCATAAPLMDFDETLLEGFYEKCVMNNYFGIGIDAKIALDFHHKREEHPEKCRSRAKNYMWYGVLGSREWLQKTYKNLEQRVQLECDGQRIPLPSLQGIVVLNIPSFMGGTNFWGGTKEDDCFLAPSFDDRILEVVAVFGSVQMAASRLINLQHHRIAQCQSVQINILGDEGVPIQVDGEAWIQPPGVIRIIHKNRMQMLCRNRALETCLKSWEEKQRLCQSQPSQPLSQTPQTSPATNQSSISVSDLVFPELLTEEESRLLLGFIEVTSILVKCVQFVSISHPFVDKDLYELASRTSCSLENVHPGGKIIEGPELRPKVTSLVSAAKDLYEEACSLLREKSQNMRLREDMENKLSAALADMEIELRKCSVDENGLIGLHHIFEQSGTNKGRGRGLFWLKLRRHGNQRQREAASWGVVEVSQWLESLQLPEYIESFTKNDIRGKELLALARRDLKELGVTKVGHVKRILQAIRDLNT